MQQVLDLAQALSDESRVRVLLALRQGELCVCQITALLGLATPTVSRHMAVLHQAGLADSRKQGRWVYYRLAETTPGGPAAAALNWLNTALKDEPTIQRDQERLRAILACEREALCRQQRPS